MDRRDVSRPPDDLRRLIDAIASDDNYTWRVDLWRLGLVGHALGGYTVLGLGGAWPSWKLPGIGAILALAPYTQPFLELGALARLMSPVRYQVGTRDVAITRSITKSDGAYDRSPASKYLVEIAGASDVAWTDAGTIGRDTIAEVQRRVHESLRERRPGDAGAHPDVAGRRGAPVQRARTDRARAAARIASTMKW